MTTLAAQYRPHIATLTFPEVSKTIKVALHQTTDPARIALLAMRLGLSESDSIFSGRLVSPTSLPSGLLPGMRCNLTISGTLGVATLQPFEDSTPTKWVSRYGRRILLSWRTDRA